MHIQTLTLQSMPCLTTEAGKSASSHILERNIKEEKKKNSTTNESERRTNLVLVA